MGIQKFIGTGEDKSFSDLYKRYYLPLLKAARYYLHDHEMAEDVVSEVFARLWEKKDNISEIKDAKAYLFIMIKRRCLDEMDKFQHKKRAGLEDLSPDVLINYKDPEIEYLNKELTRKFQESLQKLPDKCRTVFLLVKEDKLRYKEVAELLNISEKTVEMHVGNALKAVRKDLQSFILPSQKSTNLSATRIIQFLLAMV